MTFLRAMRAQINSKETTTDRTSPSPLLEGKPALFQSRPTQQHRPRHTGGIITQTGRFRPCFRPCQKQTRPETDAARAGRGKNSFPGPRRLSPGKLETGSRHPPHPSALESPAFTQPNRAHRPSHHTKTKRFQHKSKDTRAPRVGQRLCVKASTGGKLNTNHSVRNNTARSQGARKSTEWEAGETRPHPATNRHLRPVRTLTNPAAPDQRKSHWTRHPTRIPETMPAAKLPPKSCNQEKRKQGDSIRAKQHPEQSNPSLPPKTGEWRDKLNQRIRRSRLQPPDTTNIAQELRPPQTPLAPHGAGRPSGNRFGDSEQLAWSDRRNQLDQADPRIHHRSSADQPRTTLTDQIPATHSPWPTMM